MECLKCKKKILRSIEKVTIKEGIIHSTCLKCELCKGELASHKYEKSSASLAFYCPACFLIFKKYFARNRPANNNILANPLIIPTNNNNENNDNVNNEINNENN